MIEQALNFIVQNILPFGAVGVFMASVLEEVIAPIPSALIMTMSGFIFVVGPLSSKTLFALVFNVALPAALGVTLGSYVVFFAAKYGGKALIERFGKYIGLYNSDIEKFNAKLSGSRRDEVMISIARIIPVIPSVAISALCGIIGMNVYSYFVISFVGTFIRGIILGVIGWQAGNIYSRYASQISSIEQYVLIFMVIAISVFILYKWKDKKDKKEFSTTL